MRRPVGDILTELAAADPGAVAVTCAGRSVTRQALEARANRLARTYRELGVGVGDMVTIALPNCVELFEVCYGAWKVGACPQPISWRLPPRERDEIIDLADPALIVGLGSEEARGRAVVPAGFEPMDDVDPSPLASCAPPVWRAMTSGGSTGRPKLIVAGRSGEFDVEAEDKTMLRADDVQLVAGPLYHSSPFRISMLGTYLGQHVVVLPTFDAVAALEAIQTHRVTFAGVVPTMLLRMWRVIEEDPDRFDLSSLRLVMHTAAPCPSWVKEAWIGLLGPERILEAYGGSDSILTTSITGTEWLAHRGSVGRPRGGEVKVVDDAGEEVPVRTVGEIFLRPTTSSSRGYRYVGAEARRLDGGWESIGDLGWVDEDGYLYLSDRRTDLIVSGGANVYPAEVEAALLRHPGVLSCAVVGLPDLDLGHRVHAVVEASGELDTDALRMFLEEHLVRYKVPRSFRLVDEPLRDDAGKVRRSAIRDREVELLTVTGDPSPRP